MIVLRTVLCYDVLLMAFYIHTTLTLMAVTAMM